MRRTTNPKNSGLDQLLTLLFLLLAVAAMVVFFVSDDRIWFYRLGIVAVVIRLFQYGQRWASRLKRRKERASELDI